MPHIFEYFGIVFSFYSNDHLPIHIHAKSGEYETKLEFVYENGELLQIKVLKVRGKEHLPKNKLKEAQIFAAEYHRQIVQKWTDYFVLGRPVTNEKITMKIK